MQVQMLDTRSDVAAIKAALAEVQAAHNTADVMRWANCMTEDGVIMPEGAATIRGRAAAIEWLKNFYAAATVSNMKVESSDIEVSGDLAFSCDYFTATLTPTNGGAPAILDGKEIAVWRRQTNGAWKAARVIFNSNPPSTGGR